MTSPEQELEGIRRVLFGRFKPIGPANPDWYELPDFMCRWRVVVFTGEAGELVLSASRISDAGQVDGLSITNQDTDPIGHLATDLKDGFDARNRDQQIQAELGLWVGNEESLGLIRDLAQVAMILPEE